MGLISLFSGLCKHSSLLHVTMHRNCCTDGQQNNITYDPTKHGSAIMDHSLTLNISSRFVCVLTYAAGFITTYSDLHKQILTKYFLAWDWKCMMIYRFIGRGSWNRDIFHLFKSAWTHAVTIHLLNGVYELFISSIWRKTIYKALQ